MKFKLENCQSGLLFSITPTPRNIKCLIQFHNAHFFLLSFDSVPRAGYPLNFSASNQASTNLITVELVCVREGGRGWRHILLYSLLLSVVAFSHCSFIASIMQQNTIMLKWIFSRSSAEQGLNIRTDYACPNEKFWVWVKTLHVIFLYLVCNNLVSFLSSICDKTFKEEGKYMVMLPMDWQIIEAMRMTNWRPWTLCSVSIVHL